jgi:hypothetical protein
MLGGGRGQVAQGRWARWHRRLVSLFEVRAIRDPVAKKATELDKNLFIEVRTGHARLRSKRPGVKPQENAIKSNALTACLSITDSFRPAVEQNSYKKPKKATLGARPN